MSYIDDKQFRYGEASTSKKIFQNIKDYVMDFKEQKTALPLDTHKDTVKLNEREKLAALFDICSELVINHPEITKNFIRHSGKTIEKKIQDSLSDLQGRYMLRSTEAQRGAIVEAMAEACKESEEARDELDDILYALYPDYFPAASSEEEYRDFVLKKLDSFMELEKKGSKRSGLKRVKSGCLNHASIMCIRYIILFKLDTNGKDQKFLDGFASTSESASLEIARSMLNGREVYNNYDIIEEKIGAEKEGLEENVLFKKYTTRCMKKAAEWIEKEIVWEERDNKESGRASIKYPEYQEHMDNPENYVYVVFRMELEKLQKITMNEVPPTGKTYGSTQLSFILNELAEIKWATYDDLDVKSEAAFRQAVATTVSSAAYILFEGNRETDLQKTTLIRRSELKEENIGIFTTNLFYSYVLNMIAMEYKEKDLIAYQMTMGTLRMKDQWNGTVGAERYNKLKAKAEWEDIQKKRAQEQSEDESEAEDEEENSEDLDKLLKAKEQKEAKLQERNDALLEELRLLKKQKEKMEDRLKAAETAVKELTALTHDMEEDLKEREEDHNQEKYTDEELKAQRILFVGGRWELLRAFRTELPNAKYVESETDPLPDISKIDRIVYFSKFMNHCMYYNVFDKAKIAKIPFKFIHSQHHDKVWEILKQKG